MNLGSANLRLSYLISLLKDPNMSSFHRSVIRTMAIQVTTLLFTTIVSILLSRALGLEGRGIVSWMMAFSSFGSACVVLGLGQASKKYIAKMPTRASSFIVFDLVAMVLSLMIFMPILYHYGLKAQIAQNNYPVFLIALLMVPYLAFSGLFNEILIGLGRGLHFNILFVIEKSVNILFNIFLLIFGFATPIAVIAIYMFAVFTRLGVGIKYIRPYVNNLPNRKELSDNFRTMRKLIFSSYFANLAMFFSSVWLTIVLGIISPTKELGYFVVAKTLPDAALMLPSALAAFTLPHVAKQATLAGRKQAVKHIFGFAIVLTILLALPLLFFPELIILLLFGKEFQPAAECLPLITTGMMGGSMILVANQIIASQHREGLLVMNSGVLALSIAVPVLLLHNHLTAVHAAYIYAISYIIGMSVSLFNVSRVLRSVNNELT